MTGSVLIDNNTYDDVDVWNGVSAEANAVKRDTISVVDGVQGINSATEETVVWLAQTRYSQHTISQ